MSKVGNAFKNGKAFIPFVTAGDPNLDLTFALLLEMERAGADLIEIGIPFSDPVAEGVVIQRADERALASGTTTDKIFDMVKRFRKKSEIPLAFMTYMNPIFVYGVDKFAEQCQACKVDAIIVPDVPFEEKSEIEEGFKRCDVEVISMIAPTSKERIHMIAKEASGFLYCVSSMGVTGVRTQLPEDVGEMIRAVKLVSDIPCAIGFGISTPEQAAAMAHHADGIIVGSAIVRLVEEYQMDSVPYVYEYVKKMKQAIASL